MKHAMYHDMKLKRVNVDQMQVFVMIDSVEIVINADVNVKTFCRIKLPENTN